MSHITDYKDAASSAEEVLHHGMSDAGCSVCRKLRLPVPYSMSTHYEALQDAAANGCELCDLLRQVSEVACSGAGVLVQDSDVIWVFTNADAKYGHLTAMNVSRECRRDDEGLWGGEWTHSVQFYVAPGDSCPWPFMFPKKSINEYASLQNCAQLLRRMLYTCNIEHIACKAVDLKQIPKDLRAARFVPKRLLHIDSDGTSFQVYLYGSQGGHASLEGPELRYTALSHCWGSTPIVKTTTATISEYETKGISWACLPKTFQEAIWLTHQLGIYYIWIDSLCILQDSVADWANEASQMANIFSNAYLTIAASASENGHQGLLNRREIRKLEAISKNINSKVFAVCVQDRVFHEFREDHPFPRFTNSTLRKRAWCFQEEFLSKRMIHFTPYEIVFVCCEATICECEPLWVPRFKLPSVVGTSSANPSDIWAGVVEQYMERQISFCKDRLPALSSLTHLLGKSSDNYLAGLWESHTPAALLWSTGNGCRPQTHDDTQSNPPSWSWASVEGSVQHPRHATWSSYEMVAKMLGARVYPSTEDPRGLVSGGHITLRAPLLPLSSAWGKFKRKIRKFDFEHRLIFALPHINFRPGWDRDGQWSEDDFGACLLDDKIILRRLLQAGTFDTPIFLLAIRTATFNIRGNPVVLTGLLLKPLESLTEGQRQAMETSESKSAFVRIGLGVIEFANKDAEETLNRFEDTTVTIF